MAHRAAWLLLESDVSSFWFWQLLDTIDTLGQRLLATAVAVAVVVLTNRAVLPAVLSEAATFVERRLPPGRIRSAGTQFSRYVPTSLSGLWLVVLKSSTVLAAVLVSLVVWEQVTTVQTLFHAAGITPRLLSRLSLTALFLFGASVCSGAFKETVATYSEGADRISDHEEEIIVRLGNLGILVIAITSSLAVWDIALSGLLVGAGFLGIVVGMAARQTLGSLIAGFVLMFARPFTIGDWVEIGGNEGIVTNITIMNTRLKNFDGEAIVIPNDQVSNQPITNRSAQGHLRLRVDVGVDYETDPDHAEEVALDAIGDVGPVSEAPPPQVVPKAFGDSAIVLELRFWIDRPTPARKWRAISDVVCGVKQAFENEGITIPYPQRELSHRSEESRVSVGERTSGVEPHADE